MRIFPFFIVIDDGAFPEAGPAASKIGMGTYDSILKLAKEFNIRIPICMTMKYLDTMNISGVGEPLQYADEFIKFLKDNSRYVEIGYHGLTHVDKGYTGEFFQLDLNLPVPEHEQQDKIEKSAEIFSSHGLPFPEIFVPPYHAWENEVTDRILSKFGVKYLVSFRKLSFNGHAYEWKDSRYLEFLEREELGIYSYHTEIDDAMLEVVSRHMVPRTIYNNYRLRRKLANPWIHSYMLHIGNFLPCNYAFWKKVFGLALGNSRIEIAKDNKRAVDMYANGK